MKIVNGGSSTNTFSCNNNSNNGLSWRSSNNKIFGRETEIQQLDNILCSLNDDACRDPEDGENDINSSFSTSSSLSSKATSSLVEIRGMAGSGKSSFVKHYPWQQRGWLLCSGKFDTHRTAEPYSAVIEALDTLIEKWVVEEEEDLRNNLNNITWNILEEKDEDLEEEEEEDAPQDEDTPVSNLEKFQDLLKRDAEILEHVIPRALIIAGILQPQSGMSSGGARKSIGFSTEGAGEEEFISPNDVKAAFDRILSFLCSTRRVVIFLDDIQWADEPSLDVLQSLVKKQQDILQQDGGLLLAVSYREEEVKEDHKVTERLNDMRSNNVTIHTIYIRDLDVDSLNSLVAYLVRREPNDTLPLARVVHQKTAGNPFFVLQFLTLLQYEKFLQYNFCTLQWEWGETQKIQTLANISDNVAEVVAATMQRLPQETQVMLQVTSCLGRKIVPVEVLKEYFCVLERLPRHDESDASDFITASHNIPVELLEKINKDGGMEEALDCAVTNGILMECEDSSSTTTTSSNNHIPKPCGDRKWSHDKLQQFAYDQIPTRLRASWHLRLGKLLWNMSKTKKGQEWMVFTAADQMNRYYEFKPQAGTDTDHPRVEVARLNLAAAKLSMKKAALFPAMDMLRSASRYLKEENENEAATKKWNKDHYDLTLEIYSRLAEIGVQIGQHEDAMKAVEQVEANAKCIDDKFRAQCAMLTSITSGNNRDYELGVEKALEIMKLYGQKLPKRVGFIRLFIEKQKLKWNLPGGNLEGLLKLPEMMDGRAAKVTKIMLQYLWYFATVSEKYKALRPLCTLRSLNIACEKGLSESSANVALNYAIDLKCAGEYKEALKYGKFAIGLADKFPHRLGSFHCKVRLYAISGIFDAVVAFGSNLEGMLEAHKIGLRVGDTEMAVLALMDYSWAYLSVGLPIGPFQSDLGRYLKEAETLKVPYSLQIMFKIWQQTVLNLQQTTQEEFEDERDGKHNPNTILIGEAMNQEEELKKLDGGGVTMTLRDINTFRLMLACIHNDWDTAQEMVDALEEYYTKFDILVSRAYLRMTYLGLAAFALRRKHYRNKKIKTKYERLGKKALKYFQKEASLGSVNAFPVLTMLQAVESPSKEGYERAIRTCARLGLLHYEAYMCERAGEYFLNDMNDKEWCKVYFDRALSLYKDWGATGKANAISGEYVHMLTPVTPDRKSHNTALRGRRRFTKRHSKLLKSITGAVSRRGSSLLGSGKNQGEAATNAFAETMLLDKSGPL